MAGPRGRERPPPRHLMARRAPGGSRGDYLPQLTAGIRARAAVLSDAFPGIGHPTLDALERGAVVTIGALDVWSALHAVDPDEAHAFAIRNGGPWPTATWPAFHYDPSTALLTPANDTTT